MFSTALVACDVHSSLCGKLKNPFSDPASIAAMALTVINARILKNTWRDAAVLHDRVFHDGRESLYFLFAYLCFLTSQ